MAVTDPYSNYIAQIGPARHAVAVTPSDTVDLTHVSRAFYVGVAGNVSVEMSGSGSAVVIAMEAGLHPLAVKRINATGTTATGIVAIW